MPSNHKPIIGFTADVQIDAAAGEADKPKRFSVVAYTGGPMQVDGYELPVVVDLDGMTFGNNIIANLDHVRTQRVGHVTERTVEAGELRLAGVASAATQARDEVIRSAAEGFTWQASIEASPSKIQAIKEGETVKANGKSHEGPLYLVTASKLKGFAFVSHGADDDTTVSIAASAADSTKGKGMKIEAAAKEWIESIGFVVDELSEDQLKGLVANYNGRQSPKPAKSPTELEDVLASAEKERSRRQEIADITAQCLRDNPHAFEAIRDLSQHAINANWDRDRYELELLRMIQRPGGVPPVQGRGQQMTNEVYEAAICAQAGNVDLGKYFSDQTIDIAKRRFPHGCGVKQLLIECARANGYHQPGIDFNGDVLRAAFGGSRYSDIQASGFSTLSIPTILGNTANKFLERGFMSVDQAWRQIARIRPVNNFQQITTATLSGGLTAEKVGATGELKHGTLTETTYTNQADTYGKMFAISRRDIVNDDLQAMTEVPQRMGRGCAIALNEVFWTVYLNNSAFYASGNSNVSTGAGSALGTAGISAAEVIFMNQTDPDGKPLGAMPAVLLVPPTLKTTGATLMNSQFLIATDHAASASTTGGSSNVFVGRFRLVSSPYMENSSYTGYSAAAWYLLADPMDIATAEVVLLNGRDVPVVETTDADFNVLGIQMRAYHDFGVSLHEYRGGVRSAGS